MSKEDTREPTRELDRRQFLTVAGVAGAGTALLSGCSTDRIEKLVPYMVGDEDNIPGIPTYYASTCTECPAGCSLHVKTREARAIKLEGNPASPINQGSLCARGQAGLQGLYNPGRLNGPKAKGDDGSFRDLTWDEALALLAERVGRANALAVVSGSGPGTFSTLLADWTAALGGRLVRYQPFDNEAQRAANQQIFGRDEIPAYDIAQAEYILSFGADFLETWLGQVENQRGFAESHGFRDGHMAKHVYFGTRMDLTGMNADEWHALNPGSEAIVALAMANVVLSERSRAPDDANALRPLLAQYTAEMASEESGIAPETIRQVAREFASHRGLALAGGIAAQHRGATEVCAAVNVLNYVAGNVGETIHFGAGRPQGDGYGALEALSADMDSGAVDVLIVHDANPIHAVPKATGLADAMAKVGFTVSTSAVMDETAAAADLILPNLHALERWDDLDARRGVHALMQPVMMPVRDGRATGDVLLAVASAIGGPLGGFDAPSFEAHLKDRWQGYARDLGRSDFRTFWVEALAGGGIFADSTDTPTVRLASGAASRIGYSRPDFDGDGDFVFLPYPSSMLYDGRGANKPWLLENPDPVTKITWQSWIEMHPETAQELDVREGEVIRLESPHGVIEAPVYPYPGLNPGVLATPLGLGHTEYGQYAQGRGVNALDLLSGADGGGFLPYVSTRVSVVKTRRYQKLAKTEGNTRQLGRGIAEMMPFASAAEGLTVAEVHGGHHEVNTEREHEAIVGWSAAQKEATKKGDYAGEHPNWGMVVDLSRCTGCSACVTACYAENNIPTVGEEEVIRGREMSWMRIERYFEGGDHGEPVSTRVVPMMCQHCDNAPCEPVCPVYAAYHTPDGLNAQVYNRCVGTRYCSNNCSYKVRYYNWLAYNKLSFDEPLQLQLNPDVTVRARGVMEKCTFCIQRIRGAQNQASMEDRPVRDGEITTACAQACPSGAIIFGDMNDPASGVAQAGQNHRGYHILEDLNTRSSVTYLAKVQHGGEH